MCKKLRAIFVACNLSPYRIAIHNAMVTAGVPFEVVLLSASDTSRQWNLLNGHNKIRFKYHLLPGIKFDIVKREWPLNINWGLLRKILMSNAEIVVLTGYESPAYWFALLYARLLNKKVVFWSGSTLESGRSKGFFISAMRRIFIKSADAYLAYGTKAKKFLVHYGANPQKIFVSCNTVDINYFSRESSRLITRKEEIKKEKGYPSKIILFSGLLIPRKNLDVLLEAYREIANEDVGLIVLGDGPLKDKYEQWCVDNHVRNVFFEGRRPMDELPRYYAISDIFVMPSTREVWGLVVNEAMACGLPVLCSEKSGVADDLIKQGLNGFTFDPEDICALKNLLRFLLDNDEKRKEMGGNSLSIISGCTPQKYAEGLIKALNLACNAN